MIHLWFIRSQAPQFSAWLERSKKWLKPYAAFCVLRDLFGTAEHWRWGAFDHGTSEVTLLVLLKKEIRGACMLCLLFPILTAWLHCAPQIRSAGVDFCQSRAEFPVAYECLYPLSDLLIDGSCQCLGKCFNTRKLLRDCNSHLDAAGLQYKKGLHHQQIHSCGSQRVASVTIVFCSICLFCLRCRHLHLLPVLLGVLLQVVERVSAPGQEHHAKVLFIYWLQYQLHLQLLSVSDYAESKRVVLKGDLPIGTCMHLFIAAGQSN